MPSRYVEPASALASVLGTFKKLRPFSALRQRWSEGYSLRDLKADIMAGLIVGMVALPLGMALAIASGVPPQYGLYTVIVAGSIVAIFGGSRFQVVGPTAAFVVILAPITAEFGLGGLLVAGLMAGVILVVLGIARMGRLIEFIPHPVTTGFTSGIALVIAVIQLKDFFGLQTAATPEHFWERLIMLVRAAPTFSLAETCIGLFTLLFLIFWPARLNARLPAPLVGLIAAGGLAAVIQGLFPELSIGTIGNRFSARIGDQVIQGIPQSPPVFTLPWNLPGPGGQPFVLNFDTLRALFPSAVAIALLGAIESLLSAVVADGMAQTRHDPDAELVALGTGNILCPFFGGIAATGAIARTATNIRSGATSPLAAVFHALFVLLAVLCLAPAVSYLPMAALAALLLRVAWNISEVKHFAHIVRVAPRSDVVVLVTCFALTVVFDMVVGVTVGVVLAALLLMRRMASLTTARLVPAQGRPLLGAPLPQGILLYEIAGPFFFGAAQRVVDEVLKRRNTGNEMRVVILYMADIPSMDVTGLVALENAVKSLAQRGKHVILCGVQDEPLELIRKARLVNNDARVRLSHDLDHAVASALSILGESQVGFSETDAPHGTAFAASGSLTAS